MLYRREWRFWGANFEGWVGAQVCGSGCGKLGTSPWDGDEGTFWNVENTPSREQGAKWRAGQDMGRWMGIWTRRGLSNTCVHGRGNYYFYCHIAILWLIFSFCVAFGSLKLKFLRFIWLLVFLYWKLPFLRLLVSPINFVYGLIYQFKFFFIYCDRGPLSVALINVAFLRLLHGCHPVFSFHY